MVDLDGRITFSKIASLTNDGSKNATLKIYPSVSNDFLTIETSTQTAATLTFVDLLGRIVWRKEIQPYVSTQPSSTASESITTHKLSVSDFSNGIYLVILTDKDGQLVGKFVKQ